MECLTCPVCGGNGIKDKGFYNQTSGLWTSSGGTETCRSCNGKGYIIMESLKTCRPTYKQVLDVSNVECQYLHQR